MDCTAIQSDKTKNKVAKLSYIVRCSFQIVRGIERGSCMARKMNKLDSPEFMFMSEDVYILPPSLTPCEPIYSSDTRYLNQSHAKIVNPLATYINIKLYNIALHFKHDHTTLKFRQELRTHFTTLSEFHAETNHFPPHPLIKRIDTNICSTFTPAFLH